MIKYAKFINSSEIRAVEISKKVSFTKKNSERKQNELFFELQFNEYLISYESITREKTKHG